MGLGPRWGPTARPRPWAGTGGSSWLWTDEGQSDWGVGGPGSHLRNGGKAPVTGARGSPQHRPQNPPRGEAAPHTGGQACSGGPRSAKVTKGASTANSSQQEPGAGQGAGGSPHLFAKLDGRGQSHVPSCSLWGSRGGEPRPTATRGVLMSVGNAGSRLAQLLPPAPGPRLLRGLTRAGSRSHRPSAGPQRRPSRGQQSQASDPRQVTGAPWASVSTAREWACHLLGPPPPYPRQPLPRQLPSAGPGTGGHSHMWLPAGDDGAGAWGEHVGRHSCGARGGGRRLLGVPDALRQRAPLIITS